MHVIAFKFCDTNPVGKGKDTVTEIESERESKTELKHPSSVDRIEELPVACEEPGGGRLRALRS